jgi:hypothetical protein
MTPTVDEVATRRRPVLAVAPRTRTVLLTALLVVVGAHRR